MLERDDKKRKDSKEILTELKVIKIKQFDTANLMRFQKISLYVYYYSTH